MKEAATVYLALGSNMGERQGNLNDAIQLVEEQIIINERSSVYETPPWGVIDQPRFLNQVIRGQTWLTPHRLLDFLKRIEKRMGRVETVRFGPRVIDLDILLYGERIVNSNRLQIPHPRMRERAFVLVPLAEIDSNLILPGEKSKITDLLNELDQDGIIKIES